METGVELGGLFGLDDGRPGPLNWELDEVARIISQDDEVSASVVAESGEQTGVGTLKLRAGGFVIGVYISYRASSMDDEVATMFPMGFPTDYRAVFYCWSGGMRDKTADDMFQIPQDAEQVAASILRCLSDLTTHMIKIDAEMEDLTHPRRVWVDTKDEVSP